MPRRTDDDQLREHWTLAGQELAQLRGKRGPTRLAFACLLKFFILHGRFPRGRGELPDEAVAHVASQIGVPVAGLGFYDWSGRSAERQRAQIRRFLGFRECTVADAGKLTDWLAAGVCRRERRPERVRIELLERCREEKIEPPARPGSPGSSAPGCGKPSRLLLPGWPGASHPAWATPWTG